MAEKHVQLLHGEEAEEEVSDDLAFLTLTPLLGPEPLLNRGCMDGEWQEIVFADFPECPESVVATVRICQDAKRFVAKQSYQDLESDSSVQLTECSRSTGCLLWDAAPVLAEYLRLRFKSTSQPPHDHQGVGAIELGSGCGLLGIAVAKMGIADRVCFTDLSERVNDYGAPLWKNLRLNGIIDSDVGCDDTTSNGIVSALDWTQPLPSDLASNSLKFGLVLAADTIYDKELVRPLLDTTHALLQRGSNLGNDSDCRRPRAFLAFDLSLNRDSAYQELYRQLKSERMQQWKVIVSLCAEEDNGGRELMQKTTESDFSTELVAKSRWFKSSVTILEVQLAE